MFAMPCFREKTTNLSGLYTILSRLTSEKRSGLRCIMSRSYGNEILLIHSTTGLVWGLWHTPLWLMEGLSPLDLVLYAISFMGAVVGISIIMGYIFGKHRNLIYCTIIHLLFNFLNALIIIDQNKMAIVVAVYAVLYLIAAVIMILINGTASKKHSRL